MAWRSPRVKEVIVYASQCSNVWANLAFEDWVFWNVDLSYRRILFLWRNLPCVVIGRHQNPWQESNVPLLRECGMQLVRRRSGGGTVYHDLGNLNVTVFTHRSEYNRLRNLELVSSALNRRWDTELRVNKRNDIICRDRWKVSGTSSKLGKNSTYHHFTLLLNADITNLKKYLSPHPELLMKDSTATVSISSEVINLCTLYPTLTYDRVCQAIAEEFYDAHQVSASRQIVPVDPTSEESLPGIASLTEELKKWEWNFGKTPKFQIAAKRDFKFGRLAVQLEASKGKIDKCSFELDCSTEKHFLVELHNLERFITGCRLGEGCVKNQIPQSLELGSGALDIVQWLNSLF